jgi:hypothetical protein
LNRIDKKNQNIAITLNDPKGLNFYEIFWIKKSQEWYVNTHKELKCFGTDLIMKLNSSDKEKDYNLLSCCKSCISEKDDDLKLKATKQKFFHDITGNVRSIELS